MSTTDARSNAPSVKDVDLKIEAVVIPVSDADRAKEFYGSLGWRLDADFAFDNGFRVVQFTPPGSGCSIQFGTDITPSAPGSANGLYLVVSDIEAARDGLAARGVEGQRGVPCRDTGRSVPARRQRSCQQAGARSCQLRFVRDLQRPGRQRLAGTGGHDAAARPDRRRRSGIRIRGGSRERAPAC